PRPGGRVPRAVDAEAVAAPRADAEDVALPAGAVGGAQGDALLDAGVVEQGDLDGIGDAADEGEARAVRVGVGPGPGHHDGAVLASARRMIRSATRPVHPVWCEAPRPAPSSPLKDSWNSRERAARAG